MAAAEGNFCLVDAAALCVMEAILIRIWETEDYCTIGQRQVCPKERTKLGGNEADLWEEPVLDSNFERLGVKKG